MHLSDEQLIDTIASIKDFSVIVNTLNQERPIQECLESINCSQKTIVVQMHSEDQPRDNTESFGCRGFLPDQKGYFEPAGAREKMVRRSAGFQSASPCRKSFSDGSFRKFKDGDGSFEITVDLELGWHRLALKP